MAIFPADIQWYLSNPFAGTGFSGTGTPGNSLGRFMSTTQVNYSVPLDNIFTDLSNVQNASGQVDYQVVFIMNNTASGFSAKNPYVWLPAQNWTPGGANLAMAADPIGVVPYNSASQQAQVISNPLGTPPAISSWLPAPQNVFTSGIKIPDIPPLNCIAIWLQRTATDCPTLTPQDFGITCTFMSNA